MVLQCCIKETACISEEGQNLTAKKFDALDYIHKLMLLLQICFCFAFLEGLSMPLVSNVACLVYFFMKTCYLSTC